MSEPMLAWEEIGGRLSAKVAYIPHTPFRLDVYRDPIRGEGAPGDWVASVFGCVCPNSRSRHRTVEEAQLAAESTLRRWVDELDMALGNKANGT